MSNSARVSSSSRRRRHGVHVEKRFPMGTAKEYYAGLCDVNRCTARTSSRRSIGLWSALCARFTRRPYDIRRPCRQERSAMSRSSHRHSHICLVLCALFVLSPPAVRDRARPSLRRRTASRAVHRGVDLAAEGGRGAAISTQPPARATGFPGSSRNRNRRDSRTGRRRWRRWTRFRSTNSRPKRK